MPFKQKIQGPRAKYGIRFSLSVEDESVMTMIGAVLDAISPIALTEFMRFYASPYFEDQIIKRFAGHGEAGTPGGTWDPLENSTLAIRHALGYTDDEAWNERTGELLHYVAYTRDYSAGPWGATMTIPEGDADPILERKLRTAQEGYVQGPDEMIPGAYTPPRPVIEINPEDEAAMHALLHMHVAYWVASHSKIIP